MRSTYGASRRQMSPVPQPRSKTVLLPATVRDSSANNASGYGGLWRYARATSTSMNALASSSRACSSSSSSGISSPPHPCRTRSVAAMLGGAEAHGQPHDKLHQRFDLLDKPQEVVGWLAQALHVTRHDVARQEAMVVAKAVRCRDNAPQRRFALVAAVVATDRVYDVGRQVPLFGENAAY